MGALSPLQDTGSKGPLYLLSCFIFVSPIAACSTIFPGDSVDKESACDAGDAGLISSLGRYPGGGNGNPLQYSCLGNSMDRGAWQATVDSPRVRHNLVTKHHFKDSDTLKNTFYTWYKIGL